MASLILALLACVDDEPVQCDPEVYICDEDAWWDAGLADQQIDASTGTFIEAMHLPGCNDGPEWTFSARIAGSTDGNAIVNVWIADQAGGFRESHDLPIAFSDGAFHDLYATARPTDLECGVHDVQPVSTYALRIFDAGGALADCGIMSSEEDEATAIDGALATTPEQINEDNCDRWTLPGN